MTVDTKANSSAVHQRRLIGYSGRGRPTDAARRARRERELLGSRRAREGLSPSEYKRVLMAHSRDALAYMSDVVHDPSHPWHDDWGPRFIMQLAQVTTPKAVVADVSSEVTRIDVHRMIYGDGPAPVFDAAEERREAERIAALPPGPDGVYGSTVDVDFEEADTEGATDDHTTAEAADRTD